MLQELGSVKKELNSALRKMEDLDSKLVTTSKSAHFEVLAGLYQRITGINLSIDNDEQIHIQIGHNHLIMIEEEHDYIFNPVEVVSTDLTEHLKIKKENVGDFIKFLSNQQ
eukprot:NODE_204_length_14945_cov_0.251313.p13 type:complete len:111 gc:universal NODE_204_length_14945_cov_0.251313:6668-7000(+)